MIAVGAWVVTRAPAGAAQSPGLLPPTSSVTIPGTATSPAGGRKPGSVPCPVKTVSLGLTPDPAKAGDPVAASGRVQWTRTSKRRCGVKVVLWQRVLPQASFSPVASTVTGPAGRYRFSLPAGTVQTNSDWFATVRGVRSATVDQHMHAVVTLTSTATFAVAGDSETFSGQVTPAYVGQRVWLQQRTGSTWRTLATPRLDLASSFSVPRVLVNSGNQQWRAMTPASQTNIGSRSGTLKVTVAPLTGIHKIRHVVIIMQENRSFDSYFGTYPGADGIPSGVCEPDPVNGGCVVPYHDSSDLNYGGPHGASNAAADINGGLMDGFVGQAESGMRCSTTDPSLQPLRPAVDGQGLTGVVCRRDGVSRRARDSQLLDLCRGLRSPGPHVLPRIVLEPAGSPLRGLGMVGVAARTQ